MIEKTQFLLDLLELFRPFLLIIFMALFVEWTSEIDSEQLKKGNTIDDHSSRFMQRMSVILLIFPSDPLGSIGCAFAFWAAFDASLNYKMDHKMFYVGTVAKTDIFFSKRPILYKTTKIASLIIGVVMYFI